MNEFDTLDLYNKRDEKTADIFEKYFKKIKEYNDEGYIDANIYIEEKDRPFIDLLIGCFKENDIYSEYDRKTKKLYCYWKNTNYKRNEQDIKKPRFFIGAGIASAIIAVLWFLLLLYFYHHQNSDIE